MWECRLSQSKLWWERGMKELATENSSRGIINDQPAIERSFKSRRTPDLARNKSRNRNVQTQSRPLTVLPHSRAASVHHQSRVCAFYFKKTISPSSMRTTASASLSGRHDYHGTRYRGLSTAKPLSSVDPIIWVWSPSRSYYYPHFTP